eukprot:5841211-Prymnesium_polylepis.3
MPGHLLDAMLRPVECSEVADEQNPQARRAATIAAAPRPGAAIDQFDGGICTDPAIPASRALLEPAIGRS